jgi:hypothetical protein
VRIHRKVRFPDKEVISVRKCKNASDVKGRRAQARLRDGLLAA